MIIVWRGLGILVLVIGFCGSLLAQMSVDSIYGAGYFDHHRWPFAVGMVISGAACWFLGIALKQHSADPEGRSRHTLFFIPMHFWGIILLGVSVVSLFA